MNIALDGVWRGLAWGCSFAGRPSIQLALSEPGDPPGREQPTTRFTFESLATLLSHSMREIALIQIHSVQFSNTGNIQSIGDPLAQRSVYPLITHLLEALEHRVVLTADNRTDISLVDPRTNVVLAPRPPGSGLVEENYWGNLNHLNDEGELLF